MKLKFNKKFFFKIHSWIGIKLSILFFIVCFSGTLATLSHEMDWLFIPEMRASPAHEEVSRNLIVSNIQKTFPLGEIGYWAKSEEAYLCDIVQVRSNDTQAYVFVNPYTGEVQGAANLTFRRFFRNLHYFLFVPFQIGHFTVLMFSFLLFISLVTALFFYKKWWRKLFVLQTRKGPLVFYRSLHRLVGLWSVPFTLLFSITGMWYFVERANIGNIAAVIDFDAPVISEASADGNAEKITSYTVDYDRAIAVAKKEIPTLNVGSISPPNRYSGLIYMRGKSHVPLVRERANRVYVNPTTYEVVKVQKAENINTLTWINDIADPLHFGTWGGLITKIIWFIVGLGISSLVLSGIWITLKRKARLRKNRQTDALGAWKYLNFIFFGLIMLSMYYQFIWIYHVSVQNLVGITMGWAVFIGLGYYIFVYRINKLVQSSNDA